MSIRFFIIIMIGISLVGCASAPENVSQETSTSVPTEVISTLPATTLPTEITQATLAPTVTVLPTTSKVNPSSTPGILIDHQVLEQFDQLPDDVIAGAAALRVMYRNASVGENISLGLDCLWGNYPERRPNSCSDFYDLKFDRSNWSFQFRGNPSWIEKVEDFTRQTEEQIHQYDVFMFSEDYVDGTDNPNFPAISDPQNFQKYFIEPFEALEAAHPDKIFVLWSMSLARLGYENTENFNELIRAYALEKGKILIDIADIESHDPQEQVALNEQGYAVIYQGYTNETKAGHLNEVGRERMAKAFWVTMAYVAGWKGPTGNP